MSNSHIASSQQPIILFDGLCNLCDAAVQFVIRQDKKGVFKFASLQSNAGQEILKSNGLSATQLNSFILLHDDVLFMKSSAALKAAQILGWPWKFFYGFMVVPRFIRDAVYDFIARNRYRWFGKKDACMIPTKELRQRFLE